MYFRKKTSGGRAYLQIVHARREGTRIRQQVIARLGRLDELTASGQLERLLRSGARFAAKAMVLAAVQESTASEIEVRRLGPGLVFERSWAETGCRAVIEALAGRRKPGFALERAVFLTVLHRLMGGGSDLAAERWRTRYDIARTEGLELHQLYRTMAWLGEELAAAEQDGRTPLPHAAPRTWWRSSCSPPGATCCRASTWCSWTPPACTSRAPAARRWAGTAIARITAPTSSR